MTITWYGHSCFKIAAPEGSVVLDPYAADSVPGLRLPQITADIVLCSHVHRDHGAADLVSLTGEDTELRVERLGSWHDDARGEKRGGNTIHIIEGDGFRVAHLGDLGHELSEGQIRALGRLDALMIPVGGYYTIGPAAAKRVADAVGAAVTIPMHYRGENFGYDVTGTVEEFAALCGNAEYAGGNSLTLTHGGPRRIIILKLVK